MTTNHTYFEVMCALAASGQLTQTEHVELREHCEHCVLCRNRLVEMRQSGFQLFLAQAFKTPSKQLPRGVQERFRALAISKGIPLSSRSSATGSNALGMVTVLLLVLLLVTATLEHRQFATPAVGTDAANTSQVSAPLDNEKIYSHGPPKHTSVSLSTKHGSRLGTGLGRLSPAGPAAQRDRHFMLTSYSRNPGTRNSPFSTEVVPISASPYWVPKLVFDVTSEIVRSNARHLVAGSAREALETPDFRSNIAFAPLAPRNFPGSLELYAYYGTPLQVDFRAHFAAFQPIPKTILYATQPPVRSR